MINTSTTSQALPTQPRRLRRWLLGGIAALVLLVALVGFMMWRMGSVPADLDTATTRTSANGLFSGTYIPKLEPLGINQIHGWTFHLTSVDGQLLTGAQITVDGGMPQHGHGLPTSPQVTKELGNGDYQVEGMKFHMTGWWVVNFHITASGKIDTLTFNLVLK